MKRAVASLTDTFLAKAGGDEEHAASLLSNFLSQRLVQPFIYVNPSDKSPVEKFGSNAQTTLLALKRHISCCKPGSPADIMRRHIIASGASGPLTSEEVGVFFFC